MKNQRIAILTGILLLASLCCTQSGYSNNDKRYIVKLKGNVLYPAFTHPKHTTNSESELAVLTREKSSKPEPVKVANADDNNNTLASAATTSGTDFQRSETIIHNSIYQLFPGTYLDSMQIVNQLLIDSVRNQLVSATDRDSVVFLKVCLTNAMRDSMTLAQLSKISSTDDYVKQTANGEIVAHCKDAGNFANMDSVVMDVFSGSKLVASALTDKTGSCTLGGISEGSYYVIFSHKNYTPFSLMQVKVSGSGQSYVEIPLSAEGGYLFRTFGENAWIIITIASVAILFMMVLAAYTLVKLNARRTTAKLARSGANAKFKAKELSY